MKKKKTFYITPKMILGLVCMSLPFIAIILSLIIEEHEPVDGWFVFLLIFNFIIGIIVLKQGLTDLKNINAIYDRTDIDYLEKRRLVDEYYEHEREMSKIILGWNRKKYSSISIECPYCGSHDVKRISTSSRAVSTVMTGIASSKIGKQWHCNKCKSNF